MFEPSFKVGNSYSNEQILKEFQCGHMGGIRPSNKTNTIVLISNLDYGLYNNYWENDILYFYGEGINRDQKMIRHNKSLYDSAKTNHRLFLFEKLIPSVHYFLGEVTLIGEPILERITGDDGDKYLVYKFPLQLINAASYKPPNDIIEKFVTSQKKSITKLSDNIIKVRAQHAKKQSITNKALTNIFSRNPYITEYTKRRANGICELCNSKAPFFNLFNKPYLEIHHIVWLAYDGEDTIENTVALCPNCHRKMHIRNEIEDINFLKALVK